MRIYSTEPGDSVWAPLAAGLVVVVVGLLLGYFFWYAPNQVSATSRQSVTHVTVNTPAQSSPGTTVVVPSPGPAGPTGSSGPAGPAGASGSPGATGAAGDQGSPGPASPANPPATPTDNGTTAGGQTDSGK